MPHSVTGYQLAPVLSDTLAPLTREFRRALVTHSRGVRAGHDDGTDAHEERGATEGTCVSWARALGGATVRRRTASGGGGGA